MTIHSSEIILEKIADLVAEFTNSLGRYSEKQFQYTPADDQWSLGQMYEHLCQSNRLFLHVITRCLQQEGGQVGGEKTEIGVKMYSYGAFPPIKVKIPVKHLDEQPSVGEKSSYANRLSENVQQLQELLPAIKRNVGDYKLFHAACGYLNAQEWFQMVEMHLRHHLRQKRELEERWQKNTESDA